MRPQYFLVLFVSFIIFSCKKDDVGKPHPVNMPYYFRANLDGDEFEVEANDAYNDSWFGYNIGCLHYTNPKKDSEFYESEIRTIFLTASHVLYTYGIKPKVSIGFKFKTSEKPNELADYEKMITQGEYNYLPSYNSEFTKGVYISISGSDEFVEWSTRLGSADQVGSSFTITKCIDNPNKNLHDKSKLISVSFNCKLYDGKGDSILVTNGEAQINILCEE